MSMIEGPSVGKCSTIARSAHPVMRAAARLPTTQSASLAKCSRNFARVSFMKIE